jgi:RNA polymerase sigma factor (sigma-70 family)
MNGEQGTDAASEESLATVPLDVLGERLRGGDANALAALFEREASAIYHFALGYLGAQASAEDVVQAVFTRAWERHGDLRDPDRIRAWLFSIARNFVRDQLRAPSTDSFDDHYALPSPAPTPEEEAASREERELVWTAAQSLEPRQALILDLAVRQQLTSSEIGEVLGYRPGHAAVLLTRAKQALGGAVTSLLIARRVGRCERLAVLIPQGTASLSPEERRTVDHHMRRCPVCQQSARLATSPAELFSLIPLALLSTEAVRQIWHAAVRATGVQLTAANAPGALVPATGRNVAPPSPSPSGAGRPPAVAQGRSHVMERPHRPGSRLPRLSRPMVATGLAVLVVGALGGAFVVTHGSPKAPAPSSVGASVVSGHASAAAAAATCAEIPEEVLDALAAGSGDLQVCVTRSLDNGTVSEFYLKFHSTSGGVGIGAGSFVAVGPDHSQEYQSSAGFGCWNSVLHLLPNDTTSPSNPLCIADGPSPIQHLGVQAVLTASSFFFPVPRPAVVTTPPPNSALTLSNSTLAENQGGPSPLTVSATDADGACSNGELTATASGIGYLEVDISPLSETTAGTLSLTMGIGYAELMDSVTVPITVTQGAGWTSYAAATNWTPSSNFGFTDTGLYGSSTATPDVTASSLQWTEPDTGNAYNLTLPLRVSAAIVCATGG